MPNQNYAKNKKDDRFFHLMNYITDKKENLALDLIHELGIDFLNQNKHFYQPIIIHCMKYSYYPFIDTLINLGFDINIQDNLGRTSLFLAKTVEDINFLASHQANLDLTDNNQHSALELFFIDEKYGKGYENLEKIKQLIILGANYKNLDFTVLHKEKNEQIQELINNIELKTHLEEEIMIKPESYKIKL